MPWFLALTPASLSSMVRPPLKWMTPGALLEMAPPLDTSLESSALELHPMKEASSSKIKSPYEEQRSDSQAIR